MLNTYDQLVAEVREIGVFASIGALLSWDLETYMPQGGLSARAEQSALMASLVHQRWTHDKMGELLVKLEGHELNPDQAALVREARHTYHRAVKIPADLVSRLAHTSTMAKKAWAKARTESDYAQFAPHLRELLELKRQEADCVGYQQERYDALLDEYEPGISTACVSKIFSTVQGPLADCVRQLANAPRRPDTAILHRHFPKETQERWGRRLAEAIGFNFQNGRIDASVHPFCTGIAINDVRFTTRYYEDFFNPSVFGILHEAGHGLYEQGLNPDHAFTPLAQAVSYGIHESQSRLWENFVGRSRAFWERFFPEAQREFPQALGSVSLDQFHGAINAVSPSTIRVEADEVTYNLHIILRFELERSLLNNQLAIEDVPEAWNAKMKQLLGITPANDAEGCLQDIHWSMGAFGYFPTYALGNLYAAQFYAAAQETIPNLEDRFRKGDFGTLLEWLRFQIHRHGQRWRAMDLIKQVTGRPLTAEPFMNYIKNKYRQIYGI